MTSIASLHAPQRVWLTLASALLILAGGVYTPLSAEVRKDIDCESATLGVTVQPNV